MRNFYLTMLFIYLLISCVTVGCLAVRANDYKHQEGIYFNGR